MLSHSIGALRNVIRRNLMELLFKHRECGSLLLNDPTGWTTSWANRWPNMIGLDSADRRVGSGWGVGGGRAPPQNKTECGFTQQNGNNDPSQRFKRSSGIGRFEDAAAACVTQSRLGLLKCCRMSGMSLWTISNRGCFASLSPPGPVWLAGEGLAQ